MTVVMGKEAEDLLERIDQALLATDWDKLDSLTRKARRRKYISQGRFDFNVNGN